MAFFGLDPDRLPGSIVDCSAGASDFVARAQQRGSLAVAVDPAYGRDPATLLAQADAGTRGGSKIIADHHGRFRFDWYGSAVARDAIRRRALATFATSYLARPSHYLCARLPDLPFADGAFDLALCSHLLFTWADRFDRDWHRAALVEMCRVARQVRVFPLLHQGSGRPVDYLDELRASLDRLDGIASEVRTVPYEFQVGGNQLLVLSGTSPDAAKAVDRSRRR